MTPAWTGRSNGRPPELPAAFCGLRRKTKNPVSQTQGFEWAVYYTARVTLPERRHLVQT